MSTFLKEASKKCITISSRQSKEIGSYNEVKRNFEMTLNNKDLIQRPHYWGL